MLGKGTVLLWKNKTEMKKEDDIMRWKIYFLEKKNGKGNEDYIWGRKMFFVCCLY